MYCHLRYHARWSLLCLIQVRPPGQDLGSSSGGTWGNLFHPSLLVLSIPKAAVWWPTGQWGSPLQLPGWPATRPQVGLQGDIEPTWIQTGSHTHRQQKQNQRGVSNLHPYRRTLSRKSGGQMAGAVGCSSQAVVWTDTGVSLWKLGRQVETRAWSRSGLAAGFWMAERQVRKGLRAATP